MAFTMISRESTIQVILLTLTKYSTMKLSPEFVKSVPEELEDGVIYISMEYRTAIHKCCCGCGEQVVTPFSPKGWKLTFDGRVSLHPSIGNWSFPCQSHYWIILNEVKWEPKWEEIKDERKQSEAIKPRWYRSLLGGLFGKK